jgi:4-azaleucine resistance transporter AzlC
MSAKSSEILTSSIKAALPIMLGYVAIGLPCGLMESTIGFTPLMCFFVSATFYSGAGQFMYSNMWLAGAPLYSIIASISFVNTRQILYSAAFSPYFGRIGKLLSFLFAATVTDESFGVNMEKFQKDPSWTPRHGLAVNILSMTSWAVSNALGCALGALLDLPLAITAFAMTSIFICLLAGQPLSRKTGVVMAVAALGVAICKVVGLSGPAILLGAIVGVVAGLLTPGDVAGAAQEATTAGEDDHGDE